MMAVAADGQKRKWMMMMMMMMKEEQEEEGRCEEHDVELLEAEGAEEARQKQQVQSLR